MLHRINAHAIRLTRIQLHLVSVQHTNNDNSQSINRQTACDRSPLILFTNNFPSVPAHITHCTCALHFHIRAAPMRCTCAAAAAA